MATKTNAKRKTKSPSGFARKAAIVARRERSIQRRIDRKRKRKPKSKRKSAIQAGARRYPALPLPTQHLAKPGREAALKLAPMCDAQHYLGSRKLEGMAALKAAAKLSLWLHTASCRSSSNRSRRVRRVLIGKSPALAPGFFRGFTPQGSGQMQPAV
jgi:hypothetical protein